MIEKVKKRKSNKVTVSFAMSDTPLNVHKEFTKDIHLYNDIYWVKLKELMLKAKAFDAMMADQQQGFEMPETVVEDKPAEEKEEVIHTMGGPVTAGKKTGEK